MTIGDDIAEWARWRPLWQQEILQILAEGLPITGVELAAAIDTLLDPPGTSGPTRPLNLALASADDITVTLAALRSCKGINALTDDQDLDFTTAGLTVVYGDNGSGKSGYARLIKEAVGARHPAQVLPDVFEDRPDEPSAVMHFTTDDDAREHKIPGPADPLVRQMHFYDEHCGDAYLARKSVITYRPSALVLLDGLIDVCDRLRNALADRLRDNNLRALNLNLPAGTEAAQFAASLTADTTEDAIESATTLAPEATQKRADAISEVARLEASDARTERSRLAGLAMAPVALSNLLRGVAVELSHDALELAGADLQRARELREAALVAATADFNDELPGVGGATWRALWEAARAYSTDAYHGEQFPVTHDSARCPLCQQVLDTDARSRLARFDQYMRDTTERDAAAAEQVVRGHLRRLRELPVGVGAGAAHLGSLRAVAPELVAQVQACLESAGTARDAVVNWLEGAGDRPTAIVVSSEITALDAQAKAMGTAAAAVDVETFKVALEQAQSRYGTSTRTSDCASLAQLFRERSSGSRSAGCLRLPRARR
jgi:hypothetical protein